MPESMRRRKQSRELESFATRAEVTPASLNAEARTVEVTWSTGQRVKRGMFDPFLEELSMDPAHIRMGRLAGGAPVLDSHRSALTSSVIGVVENARLAGGQGVATLRFATGDAQADSVWNKITQGVLRAVSVGYRTHRLEETDERGDEGLRVFRATDWEPFEISVVPIGADAGASVRSEGARPNLCEFVLAERTADMANDMETPVSQTPDTEQRAAAPAPESAAPETPVIDLDAVRAEARKAEQARIAEIQRTANSLKLSSEFVQRHVADGTKLDAFRAAAFDEYERRSAPPVGGTGTGPEIVPGEDERDKFVRAGSDWLIARAGVGEIVREAEKKKGLSGDIDGGDYRGMTFLDLARHCLSRNGVSTRGWDKMRIFGEALTMRSGGLAATGDFPVLLETSLERTLLAQYAITQDKWSLFCATGSVPDFRAVKRLRMGTFGSLETVNEAGEFRTKSIPDARAEQINADTKGNIIGLTRQTLVNDDIGFVSRLATMLGRAARLSIEVDVFALLAENSGLGPNMTDGNPLFDASHGNLGAGAALSIAALDADATILAEQTDESGNETLEINPYALLVPRGLQSKALQINGSEFDVDSGAVHSRVPNVVQGMFERVIGTTRLSGTRRYMFADPNIVPTIEVVFLDGNDQPFLESRNGWSVDGVEWKVRLDYGVGAIDYRGALTDAGA